jgi:hypothetical protein
MLASYVVYAYLLRGVSHSVLALAAGVALLFGLQLVMFGVLSELIVSSNRRQTRELERIADRLDTGGTDPVGSGGLDRGAVGGPNGTGGGADSDADSHSGEDADTPEATGQVADDGED